MKPEEVHKAQETGAEEYGFLTQKHLLGVIEGELNKKIVDEYDARLAILLVGLGGRLTLNAAPTSKNLMVNDDSGAGKDHVTHNVLAILPKDWVVKRKKITPEVFTYWKNADVEPDWTWDGKVLYLEDLSNKILNCDTFKVMSSSNGDNESTVVIKQKATEIVTKGKPVMIITIAAANPGKELLRRYPIVNLTTTREQTRKILERQALYAAKGISPEYDFNIKQALYKLKPVKVKVLFAEKMVRHFSYRNIMIRTNFLRFLDYVKFSAAIHQLQRRTQDGYVIAEAMDYEVARNVFAATTSNSSSVPLTKVQKSILSVIEQFPDNWWSVSDLEPKIKSVTDRTLRTQLKKLTDDDFLEVDTQDREESKRPVMVWQHKEIGRLNLPKWEDINKNISSVSTTSFNSFNSNVSSDLNKKRTNETNETNSCEITLNKNILTPEELRAKQADLEEEGEPLKVRFENIVLTGNDK